MKNMKNIITLHCLMLALTMTLYSDEGADRKTDWFNKLDSNSDGKVSKQEYLDKWEPHFGRGDIDKSGNLSIEEWITMMGDKSESISRKQFAKHDTNGDKKLSKAEYLKFRGKIFDGSDTDGDGFWTNNSL